MKKTRLLQLACALIGVAASSIAGAQAPLLGSLGGPRGFGSDCLHRNDDGSSPLIDLTEAFPAGLRFFDEIHTSVYVNTNGNLTFSGPLSTFTPNAFPVANRPMIAPYWADVDIRHPAGSDECSATGTTGVCPSDASGGNAVWWHLEPGRMVVTWDEVGYYECSTDLRMHFQLILTAVPSCGGGATDFDVEFRFNRCEWETGDASGGTDGFGGTEGQSGFDAGNSTDFIEIPGSREPGIADLLCSDSNLPISDPGVWRFQIRSGRVICPDAGAACTTGDPGVCGEGVVQCVGGGTECQAVVPASDEICDALDNDCDGSVDEGESICPGLGICDRGVCTDVCFEGSCPTGLECNDEGRCAEPSCADVECPAGQRCSGGECVEACAGITCPLGQDCVAGRCLDLCEDLECDPECSVCSDGECVPRCDSPADCPTGETCYDGICEPTECAGVSCPAGTYCLPGGMGCVDACASAVCPTGETCDMGACVPNDSIIPPDMGLAEEPDSGMVIEQPDLGQAEPDMGRVVGTRDDGCGCTTLGTETGAPVFPLFLSGLVLLGLRRRRD